MSIRAARGSTGPSELRHPCGDTKAKSAPGHYKTWGASLYLRAGGRAVTGDPQHGISASTAQRALHPTPSACRPTLYCGLAVNRKGIRNEATWV